MLAAGLSSFLLAWASIVSASIEMGSTTRQCRNSPGSDRASRSPLIQYIPNGDGLWLLWDLIRKDDSKVIHTTGLSVMEIHRFPYDQLIFNGIRTFAMSIWIPQLWMVTLGMMWIHGLHSPPSRQRHLYAVYAMRRSRTISNSMSVNAFRIFTAVREGTVRPKS